MHDSILGKIPRREESALKSLLNHQQVLCSEWGAPSPPWSHSQLPPSKDRPEKLEVEELCRADTWWRPPTPQRPTPHPPLHIRMCWKVLYFGSLPPQTNSPSAIRKKISQYSQLRDSLQNTWSSSPTCQGHQTQGKSEKTSQPRRA